MINRFVYKLKTKSANRSNEGNRRSVNYKTAKNIGILFSVKDIEKHNVVKKFIEELMNDGKNVTAISYLPKGKDNFEFKFDFFTFKEFSYFGSINNDSLNSFINQPFDFLFFLDNESGLLSKYILAHSKAKCRVGKLNNDMHDYFELMVKPKGKNTQELAEDIYNYIKKIQ